MIGSRCGLHRRTAMPIRNYIADKSGAFGPDDLKVMGHALSAALTKVGLHDLKDPMTEMVARRIIRAALAGERSVIKLTEIGAGGRE
jgi:hypothetical protein